MVDFEKATRHLQIDSEPISTIPRAFIAQRDGDIAYRRVRTAVAEVDDSAKMLPGKDQVFPAHVTMNGKAGQCAVSRAAELLQHADAFLHARPEESMVIVVARHKFQLQAPKSVQKPRMFESGGD